jgi:hypothetical protein
MAEFFIEIKTGSGYPEETAGFPETKLHQYLTIMLII